MKEFMCGHADEGIRLEIVELTADHDMGVVVLQTSGGIGLGRREEIKINVLVVGQIVEPRHAPLRQFVSASELAARVCLAGMLRQVLIRTSAVCLQPGSE